MLYYAIILFVILAGLYFYIDDKGPEYDYKNDYVMWAFLGGLVIFLIYFNFKNNTINKIMNKSKFSQCQVGSNPYTNSDNIVIY